MKPHSVPFASATVRWLFERLFLAYGAQHWWPGDTPFEVMVGAVLTQNTAWNNVEKAMRRLKSSDKLNPSAILHCTPEGLAELIRPVGYLNVKARRLQSLCSFLVDKGGFQSLALRPTVELRELLLRVHGVGPETADGILLYAFERPVFVVDAYTRRLGERLGMLRGGEGYEAIRSAFETALGADVQTFNELHALIVRHGKQVCRKRPVCSACGLADRCPANSTPRQPSPSEVFLPSKPE